MDTFTPFQSFEFNCFEFQSSRYEEYSKGKCISSGNANITVLIKKNQHQINVKLLGNTLASKIKSEFEFDVLISLEDRLQLTIFPQKTNVEDTTFTLLKWIMAYTREVKNFTSTEPIVGHIFTNNMKIVKIAFKMANPERLIELY